MNATGFQPIALAIKWGKFSDGIADRSHNPRFVY